MHDITNFVVSIFDDQILELQGFREKIIGMKTMIEFAKKQKVDSVEIEHMVLKLYEKMIQKSDFDMKSLREE